ncbi:transcriptional repressor LexA [Myxococcota bacterium]|nr:transcriptional repressor LexA [Myxococcota bacterium]
MALTRRQRQIYDFIREFVSDHGYSPSLEEIGAEFGLSSVATVHKHVQHLVEKGFLRKAWNRSRSVEPVGEPGNDPLRLPLLGEVAAGVPIEAIEAPETIDVPVDLASPGRDSFVLRVRGDSMIEEQIRDGDFVVVESRDHADDGETVVALLYGQDTTLKKLYRSGETVRLEPANPSMAPIEVPAHEVQIRGVVRGLIRRYASNLPRRARSGAAAPVG